MTNEIYDHHERAEDAVLRFRAFNERPPRGRRQYRARVAALMGLVASILNLVREINLANAKLGIAHDDAHRALAASEDRRSQQVTAANATIGGLSRGLTHAEEEIQRLSGIARRDLATMREQSERISDLETTLAQRDEAIAEHDRLLDLARGGTIVELDGVKLQACDEYGRTETDRELAQHRAHETGHPSTSEVVQGAARILAERAADMTTPHELDLLVDATALHLERCTDPDDLPRLSSATDRARAHLAGFTFGPDGTVTDGPTITGDPATYRRDAHRTAPQTTE